MLRAIDYRALVRLTHECRDVGDDPHAWRERLGEGLHRLAGCDLVFCVEMGPDYTGRPAELGTHEWGWHQGHDPKPWHIRRDIMLNNDFISPLLTAYMGRLIGQPKATHAREELLSGCEWDRSADREYFQSNFRLEDMVFSFAALETTAPAYGGLICPRSSDKRYFTKKETELIAEASAMITPMIGRSLARFHEPSASDLPPRVREVVRCLLEGDSDKQIASQLQISRYTVNQYTKVIYRHFGVAGRAELIARALRRKWVQ